MYLTSERINKDSYWRLDSASGHYLILFLVWPFIAFLTALVNYRDRTAKNVVYLFLIYYGLNFYNNNEYLDAFRYVLSLQENALRPFSEIFNIVGGLYGDTSVDIVEPLISFLISRFSTDAGIYFAVWTALLGFFYLKSINLLHDQFIKSANLNALVLMIFFILILPITAVSGIRMPTATWIFFYGACKVIFSGDKRYILLALSASLVHWSFITANVVLIAYVLMGNKNIVYLPIAIVSFIMPHLAAPFFRSLSMSVGGVLQARYEGYSSEGYIQGMQDAAASASWFVGLSDSLVFYFLLLLIIVIQIDKRIFSSSKTVEVTNLYSFLLLFIAFVNFGKVIPTFGGRFQTIFYLFATLYVFMHFVKERGRSLNWTIILGLFPMLLYSLMYFRIGSETINAWIFAPLFGSPLFNSGLSVAELLFN